MIVCARHVPYDQCKQEKPLRTYSSSAYRIRGSLVVMANPPRLVTHCRLPVRRQDRYVEYSRHRLGEDGAPPHGGRVRTMSTSSRHPATAGRGRRCGWRRSNTQHRSRWGAATLPFSLVTFCSSSVTPRSGDRDIPYISPRSTEHMKA